ncbi:NUDIX hydrolase [Pseudoclavibacter helvolus]|uniref:NUDIX hydrolase n=1 Tax=Pseudoclavibacter helvolus TaxID=255205 RepID=UPI000838646E|nr:NUDIX domain-containing protein [Pseudoclavibacter helvolus]
MHRRLASYGVIVRDGQILLAHWHDRGRSGWTLPGGGTDPGEDPIDGVVREIWEETGYHASIDRLLGIDSHIIAGRDRLEPGKTPMQSVRIVYEASIVSGELRNERGGSTDEAQWFDLDEISALRTVSLVDVGLRLHAERPANGHLRPVRGAH